MRPADIPEIRRLPLFRDMAEDEFKRLVPHAYAQVFPAGLELVRMGDRADFLHVVIEGSVELFATWEGRQCTMAILEPVGTFILAACIRDAPYLMSARTLQRSRLVLIPAGALRRAFRNDVAFALSVLDELAGTYRAMVRHAKGLKLRNSRERIAAYLMRQSVLAGEKVAFRLPIEKRHLASYLGMTPENLSRTLRLLEGEGVKIDGSLVIITDRKRLADVARLDPLLDGPDLEGIAAGLPVVRKVD